MCLRLLGQGWDMPPLRSYPPDAFLLVLVLSGAQGSGMIIAAAGQSAQELGGSSDQLRSFALVQLAEYKPTMVVIGVQPGWDHALGFTAIDLQIPLMVIVPYAGYESKYSAGLQKKIQTLIAESMISSWLPRTASTDRHADLDIVNHADAILALVGPGKEHNRVKDARMLKLQIIDCWPEWKEVRE